MISSTSNKVTYSGNGTTTQFPYAFPVPDASDIQVWITDASGNQAQIFSNFQVDTINTQVLYPTTGSPLPSDGSKITILREIPLTQDVTLTNTGPFPASVLEKAYDKLTLITQQLMEVLSRTLQFPIGTVQDPTQTADLLAEIEAGSANAAAAQAAAAAAAASAASISYPISVANGGTGSTTALTNGKLMQSSGGLIVESSIDVNAVFKPGMSIAYRGATAPAGWLIEDGSVVSQTTYAALYAVISSTYNTGGEGTGNFRLPDSRGRVNIGAGTGTGLTARTLGQKIGEESHVLITAEMPNHGHSLTDPGHNHSEQGFFSTGGTPALVLVNANVGGTTGGAAISTTSSVTGISMSGTGGDGSHNNMQPTLVATHIIKT